MEHVWQCSKNFCGVTIPAGMPTIETMEKLEGFLAGIGTLNWHAVFVGAGNVASALFGGIPATGAIACTAANIKNGGRTPVAGMVHAVVLFLVLLVLMPYAGWIPMPTIAAILFIVAYNMCQWRPFVRLVKTAPKSDIAVLVITFMLTVVFDLVVAIEVGMVLACLLFMKRMSDETGVRNWSHTDEISDEVRDAERARMRDIPSSISVCEITGPLFFGAADQIGLISVTEKTKCLILRMRGVLALDSTAMNSLTSLYEKCRKKKITLILSHVNDQPMRVIKVLGENPGACPWDEAKKYFSKSLMSISSEYTLQI